MKEEILQLIPQLNTRDQKRWLWTIKCQQLDKLKEIGKFLETHNLPTLSHEEIENLHRPITSKEVK